MPARLSVKKGKTVTTLTKIASFSVLALSMSAGAASAQDNYFARDRVVGAGERVHPDFTPQPIRAGTWKVMPSVGVSAVNNSNIYATDQNEESGVVVGLNPTLNLQSDWNRHAVAVYADVQHNEYVDQSDESHTNYSFTGNGRLDVTRDVAFEGRAGAARFFENRGSTSSANGIIEPAEDLRYFAGATGRWSRDRIRVEADLDVFDNKFEDFKVAAGSPVNPDRSFRDNTELAYGVNLAYAISPDIAVFGAVKQTEREFDKRQLNGTSLDTTDTTVLVGADFQYSLFRGKASIGYFSNDPKDSAFDSKDGLGIDADVAWLPTQLTTLRLKASRGTVELGVANAPTGVVTDTELRVDHELKRNILLFARAGFRNESFDETAFGVDFDNDYTTFGAGADYILNPNARVGIEATHRERESDQVNRDYKQDIIGVSLRLNP